MKGPSGTRKSSKRAIKPSLKLVESLEALGTKADAQRAAAAPGKPAHQRGKRGREAAAGCDDDHESSGDDDGASSSEAASSDADDSDTEGGGSDSESEGQEKDLTRWMHVHWAAYCFDCVI